MNDAMEEPLTSLAPHRASEIEWWYLHGLLEERWFLVVCFWRYRGTQDLPEGMTATYSLTALDRSRRVQASLVDAPFLGQIRALVDTYERGSPDTYLEAFQEATEDGRLFAPYRLVDRSVLESEADGLRVRVGPCRLSRPAGGGGLRLSIDDEPVAIALTIDDPGPGFAMGRDGSFTLAGKRMWGRTWPRLAGLGTLRLGGVSQAVAGTFWFDHQWGEWSFGKARWHFYHPEWLYYVAVLADGRSLVIFEAKRPRGRRRARELAYVALQAADGTCRYLQEARIVARDRFESLHTYNSYECGWTVELPEVGGRLEFEPFHRDQEVFVFTRQRGILELGCRVDGVLDGAACSGWGFVEVFGDTLDVNEYFWGQEKTNLARELERFLPRAPDAGWLQRVCQARAPLDVDEAALAGSIFSPLWSMMDRGGKGWRSAWLTTCYHAYDRGDFDEQVRALLPIVEILHTGSLIIDDIQDGATLRRQRAALHVEFGTDIAINVGCFAYFLPLLIIEELRGVSDAQRARMYGIVVNALRRGHLGQAADLMWSKGRYDVAAKVREFAATRAQLVEQYRLKSGCQLEAVARIAGVLAGAPEEMVESAAAYSMAFGVAFQIIDDIVGIQDAYEDLGKEAGEDVTNGKLNMVLLYALAAVDGPRRAWWIRRLFESGGEGDGTVRAARQLIDETDSVSRCLDFAAEMIEAVWPRMSALPPTSAKIIMRSVPQWLLLQRRSLRGGVPRTRRERWQARRSTTRGAGT